MLALEVRMKNILQAMHFQKRFDNHTLFHVVSYGYRILKQHRTAVSENYTLPSKMSRTTGLPVDYALFFGKHNCIVF